MIVASSSMAFSLVVVMNYAFAALAGWLMSIAIRRRASRAWTYAILGLGYICVLAFVSATPLLCVFALVRLTDFASLAGWEKLALWLTSFLLSGWVASAALENALGKAGQKSGDNNSGDT
jgi:hypothetical protein